jgi:hypothetical protein
LNSCRPADGIAGVGEERDRLYGLISAGASEYEQNTDRVFPIVVLDGVPAPCQTAGSM